MRPVKRVDLVFYVPRRCAFYSIIGFSSLSTHESPQNLASGPSPAAGGDCTRNVIFDKSGDKLVNTPFCLRMAIGWLGSTKPASYRVNLPTIEWNETASRDSA
jgi:hypothetical protein